MVYLRTGITNQTLAPPFGDIMVIDLVTQEISRLTDDKFLDENPTFYRLENCIYFSSKRGKYAETLHLGSKSDLYKYSLKDNKINNARDDIKFALTNSKSWISNPLVSQMNDSLIAFIENGKEGSWVDKLILCNLKRKKIEFETNADSIVRYFFTKDYFFYQTDNELGNKARFISLDLKGSSLK